MTPATLSATLQRLGLSQAECARLLGVTPGAVTRWVRGDRQVPGPVVRLVWLLESREFGPDVLNALSIWLPPGQRAQKNPAPPQNNR